MKKSASKPTSHMGIEDFLLYYSKAYRKGNIDALYQLSERYPDLLNQACQLALSHHQDPSDEEFLIPHPIVLSSAYFTERRVLDMVAYLLCKPAAPKSYRDILRNQISYQEIYNYSLNRYKRSYEREELWNKFFGEIPELKDLLVKRKINSLEELEYHAARYFEEYPS